jgi:Ctf8
MIVEVVYDESKRRRREWMVIELQGTLEVQNSDAGFNGVDIGMLGWKKKEFSQDGGEKRERVPLLHIGNHTLQGRIVPLKKPLVLLRKVHLDSASSTNSSSSGSASSSSSASDSSNCNVVGADGRCQTREMRAIAIVRRKLVFKNRPKLTGRRQQTQTQTLETELENEKDKEIADD